MVPSGTEPDPSPVMSELTKKMHFFRFLQKEINAAKTEAEKEAVFGILMKTRIQIRALQVELKRVRKLQQPHLNSDCRKASEVFPVRTVQ